jgi:hypothetical protein
MRIKHGMPYVRALSGTWIVVNDFFWWEADIVPRRVRLNRLIATQPYVTSKGLAKVEHDHRGRPISVVRINNKLYIRDGHHRTTRALRRGQKTIAAHVVEIT